MRRTAVLVLFAALAPPVFSIDLVFTPLESSNLGDVIPEIDDIDVLLIGESPHYTAELPRTLIDSLLPQLSQHGYGLYMAEAGHAAGWIANRYVSGRLERTNLPSWILSGDIYEGIRRLNEQSDTRIRVKGIDLNFMPWAFRVAMDVMATEAPLPEPVRDALAEQFGGEEAPDFPAPGATRAQLLHTLNAWLQNGYPHREAYAETLEAAVLELQHAGPSGFHALGEDRFDELLELLEVELETAIYRAGPRAAHRERVMFENAERGLVESRGRAVLLAGLGHAERSLSDVSGNTGIETTVGRSLARRYATFHLFAYGMSGERVANWSDGRVITFDHSLAWPADNLMTRLFDTANGIGFVRWAEGSGLRRIPFGIHELRPDDHWDAVLVFPQVTVHQQLR